jgi:hypothetical protein
MMKMCFITLSPWMQVKLLQARLSARHNFAKNGPWGLKNGLERRARLAILHNL